MFEGDIDWLYQAGITEGCGDGGYCPDDPVTRGQLAAFLHRLFTFTMGAVGSQTQAGVPGPAGPQGLPGPPGASCTVVDHGDYTFTMTCPDGSQVTWAGQPPPPPLKVAVGLSGAIVTSTDGQTWVAVPSVGTNNDLYGVATE